MGGLCVALSGSRWLLHGSRVGVGGVGVALRDACSPDLWPRRKQLNSSWWAWWESPVRQEKGVRFD